MEYTPITPKASFYTEILQHYTYVAQGNIPTDLLERLAWTITDYLYSQYLRFRTQHPKSVKRYSTLHSEDITHPFTKEKVVKFFKDEDSKNYRVYASAALGITQEELQAFENNQTEFWAMW